MYLIYIFFLLCANIHGLIHHLASDNQICCERPRRIAAYRALSTTKPDSMARIMAGEEYVLNVQNELQELGKIRGLRAVYNEIESVAVLQNWTDTMVSLFLGDHSDVKQIVVMQSGMTSIAYTQTCLKGKIVYEVDDASVIFLKRQFLKNYNTKLVRAQEVRYCVCDWNQDSDWIRTLVQNGWMADQPSVVVVQDMFDNMPLQQVEAILKTIESQFAAGGIVLFNTHRMQDDAYRILGWLKSLNFRNFGVDYLENKDVHGGKLFVKETDFENCWLICCML